MNKIGILYGYWCTEWDVDYIPYLERVKQLGFDTLEINTLRLTKMSDAEIEHFHGTRQELQESMCSRCIGVPAQLDPAAPDAAVRKAGIDYEIEPHPHLRKGRYSLCLRRALQRMALPPGNAWRHQSRVLEAQHFEHEGNQRARRGFGSASSISRSSIATRTISSTPATKS